MIVERLIDLLIVAAATGFLFLIRGRVRQSVPLAVAAAFALLEGAGRLAALSHDIHHRIALPITKAAFRIPLADHHGIGRALRFLVGYQDNPSWLEVALWLGYLVAGALFLLGRLPFGRHERVGAAVRQ